MAKILHLHFCSTCKKQLKTKAEFTKWEGAFYCYDCFDIYLEMIEENDFFREPEDD